MKNALFLLLLFCLELNAKGVWANRFVTYDILSGIFGPKAHQILEEKVLSEYQVFGGACSLMEANISKKANNSGLYYCRTGSPESKTRAYANDLVRRNALILSACQQLTAKEDSFNHLFYQIMFFTQEKDRAKEVIKKFYPTIENGDEVAINTYNLTKRELEFPFKIDLLPATFFNEKEVLKRMTYYTCISEKWQKL